MSLGFDCLRAPSATNGGDVTVSAIQLTTLGLEGTLTLVGGQIMRVLQRVLLQVLVRFCMGIVRSC